MSAYLLSERHLEFLSLTVACTCSCESTQVNMQHCWKSHVPAQIPFFYWLIHIKRNVLPIQIQSVRQLLIMFCLMLPVFSKMMKPVHFDAQMELIQQRAIVL